MGVIYFNQRNGKRVPVSGPERNWMAHWVTGAFVGVLPVHRSPEKLARLFTHEQGPSNPSSVHLSLEVGSLMDYSMHIKGEDPSLFTLQLNTALAIGNDVLKLCARMHGQCELHAFVRSAENQLWLAYIIGEGLDSRMLRKGMGWEAVVEELTRDTGPLVMCYSVSDDFPNPNFDNIEPRGGEFDERYRWFDELSHEEQWDLAFEGLEKRSETDKLELCPDDWDTFRFRSGLWALDIIDEIEKVK